MSTCIFHLKAKFVLKVIRFGSTEYDYIIWINNLSFLSRVKDGKWGGIVNGSWNGLVAELINHDTDVVMTSLKINSGRETVIDFSVPFLETGITILGKVFFLI